MKIKFIKNKSWIFVLALSLSALLVSPVLVTAKGKKKAHPFDQYNHDMHTALFEGVVECELCHKNDPDYTGNRDKINPLGCHVCHKDANPPLAGPKDCNICHVGGKFPKPESHRADWKAKHQVYAKQDPKYCAQCHQNSMFCIDCHKRRDTIDQKMHRRNFRYVHSIEARANPRRCEACHTIAFCARCHAGRGDSKR